MSNTVNNVICGNYIGVNASGETALGNQLSGIGLFGGTGNIIGGTVAGARNVISGNTNGSYYDYGVFIANPGTSGNVIEGNYIGLGADGLTPVPNYYGVLFAGGAANNTARRHGRRRGQLRFRQRFLRCLYQRSGHQRKFGRGQFYRHRCHRHQWHRRLHQC